MKTLRFPELRQTFNFDCGACSLSCVLVYFGIEMREDNIIKLAGTTKDGTDTTGILKVLAYFGLKYSAGQMTTEDIRRSIDKKHPVIITLQAYGSTDVPYCDGWDDGHYVVAIGYDDTRIYFEDPAAYRRTWLSDTELAERWHDIEGNGNKLYNWGCIVEGMPKFKPNDSVRMD